MQGTKADAPLITVKQSQAYPTGYSSVVPKGKFLDGGYPIRLRVGSTDALVMKQVRECFLSYLPYWLAKLHFMYGLLDLVGICFSPVGTQP